MYMIVEVSQYVAVASFSEAWIEIIVFLGTLSISSVASFSEAWIEIVISSVSPDSTISVASFSEAWIEIYTSDGVSVTDLSRLLLGGVD